MKKVFIDGSSGTTGLRIRERLSARRDVMLLTLPENERHDPAARARAINGADVTFLCLPDEAARQAVSMCENPDAVIIDASTAHRTDPRFVYGFPELVGENAVAKSKRIALPGCHASGFIALIRPLVLAGIVKKDARLCCTSLTGYSGGGKKMIAEYEAKDRDALYDSPRIYALGQQHKHLKEMTALTGLENPPAFMPIVADFYSGMEVCVPLFARDIEGGAQDIINIYKSVYNGPVVSFCDGIDNGGFAAAGGMSGSDGMKITVSGNGERILLLALYDNLGKGASGAGVECFNLVTGAPPTAGLVI